MALRNYAITLLIKLFLQQCQLVASSASGFLVFPLFFFFVFCPANLLCELPVMATAFGVSGLSLCVCLSALFSIAVAMHHMHIV